MQWDDNNLKQPFLYHLTLLSNLVSVCSLPQRKWKVKVEIALKRSGK